MKFTRKIILFLMVFMYILISCTSCDQSYNHITTNEVSTNIEESVFSKGPYTKISADWPVYDNAVAVINASSLVFIGKVTGVEFQILDSRTALNVSESTPKISRQLYTIYHIDIETTYKGDTSSIDKIRVRGGMVDYNVEDQIDTMKKGNAFNLENGIPIWDNYSKIQCSIGSYYLFALYQFESGYPTIINLDQSIYNLDDPSKKQTIGNNNGLYYSGILDEFGLPIISPRDIISEFGTQKLNHFYDKWNRGEYITQSE